MLAVAACTLFCCSRATEPRPTPDPKVVDKAVTRAEPAPADSMAASSQPSPTAAPSAEPAEPATDDRAAAPSAEPKPLGDTQRALVDAPPTKATPARPPQPTKAAAQEPKPKPALDTMQRGPAVVSDEFSTWLEASGKIELGKPAQLSVVLVAKDPYKCNEQYPYSLRLDPAPAGISYPEPVVRRMRVSKQRSSMGIPIIVQSAGTKTISGQLSFSVCTEERCLVEKRQLTLRLQVD